MGIIWPTVSMGGSNMEPETQAAAKKLIEDLGDAVGTRLAAAGLGVEESPFQAPFCMLVVQDDAQVLVSWRPADGMPTLFWIEMTGVLSGQGFVQYWKQHIGGDFSPLLSLPLPNTPGAGSRMDDAANRIVSSIEREHTLRRLGKYSQIGRLEPSIHDFLNHHPHPDRNVFVMMRFGQSKQLQEIYAAIRVTLADYGLTALRADEREYCEGLWDNIEVYLTGCQYGIAVFEDVDKREFNPNVSLELGYCMGRGKRTLLLKEERLPDLPSDIAHRLYKPFDIFSISESVSREVRRWAGVDLGLKVEKPASSGQ